MGAYSEALVVRKIFTRSNLLMLVVIWRRHVKVVRGTY